MMTILTMTGPMTVAMIRERAMGIAPFTDRDFPFVYMADISGYDDPWELEDYNHPSRMVLMATEHRPVGFVAWRIVNKGKEGCYALIDKLVVLPKYRGKGHGTRLLAKCLNDTRRYKTVLIGAILERARWLSSMGFVTNGKLTEDDYGYSWLTWTHYNDL